MTTIAAARPGRPPKPMSAWRLEWLRMIRSPRAIVLGAVYLFFGLLGPVTAKYLPDIVNRVQTGMQIIVAHPTPKDGIANYISQASQTGLVVVVVIAAGALTFDARRGLSTFLRTRAEQHVAAHRAPVHGQRGRGGRRLHPRDTGRLVRNCPASWPATGLAHARRPAVRLGLPYLRRLGMHGSRLGGSRHTRRPWASPLVSCSACPSSASPGRCTPGCPAHLSPRPSPCSLTETWATTFLPLAARRSAGVCCWDWPPHGWRAGRCDQ